MVFVGDSLMNPRCFINLLPEQTYIYQLEMFWRNRFPDAYARSLILPGYNIKQINEYFHASFFPHECGGMIDMSVLQCGIIDCAPRVLTPFSYFVVTHLPVSFQKRIRLFLRKNRPRLQRAGWSFRHTSPEKFEECYRNILNSLSPQSKRVYAITIAPGIDPLYVHSPGLKDSIIRYNKIIRKVASDFKNLALIDIENKFQENPDNYLTNDLHITRNAHDYIFKRIHDIELAAIQQDVP